MCPAHDHLIFLIAYAVYDFCPLSDPDVLLSSFKLNCKETVFEICWKMWLVCSIINSSNVSMSYLTNNSFSSDII